MNANAWGYVILACVLVAIVGFTGFTSVGCANLMIKDPSTNEWRPATEAEIAEWQGQQMKNVANVASTVLATTGQPQYIPFIDIAVRIAASLIAFFALQRQKKAAAPPG